MFKCDQMFSKCDQYLCKQYLMLMYSVYQICISHLADGQLSHEESTANKGNLQKVKQKRKCQQF
jgi:hypothetical protein